MPIASLNRDTLRQLAASRLEEARVLLENRLWTGAYYLTGFAVECALKSCLAGTVREHDFPDKRYDMYVHDIGRLFGLNAELWAQLQADMKTDPKLSLNWSTVKDWDDSKRYDTVEELDAVALYEAVTDQHSGIMLWIRRGW